MGSSRVLVILIPAASRAGLVSRSPLTPSVSRPHQGLFATVTASAGGSPHTCATKKAHNLTPLKTSVLGNNSLPGDIWGRSVPLTSVHPRIMYHNQLGISVQLCRTGRKIHPGPALLGPRTPPTISSRRNRPVSAARLHPHSEFRAWFLFDSIIETEPSAQRLPNQFCLRC